MNEWQVSNSHLVFVLFFLISKHLFLDREQMSPLGTPILGHSLMLLSPHRECVSATGLIELTALLISPHSVSCSRRPSLGMEVEAIQSLADHAPE